MIEYGLPDIINYSSPEFVTRPPFKVGNQTMNICVNLPSPRAKASTVYLDGMPMK